jgi:hypothetical protein
MVKEGLFSVQLVHAETMIPFAEHEGPDGKHYVEVEPNVEYWIRIASSDASRDVICNFQVDGKKLGINRLLNSTKTGCPSDVGLWEAVGEQSTEHSFQVRAFHGRAGKTFYIGNVQVDFHEAIAKPGSCQPTEFVNQWNGDQARTNYQGSEKEVASQVGTVVKTVTKCKIRYGTGRLLQTITLHYCTTMGLIHVKVLPQPESWEYHRMRFPADNATNGAVVDMEPEIMKVQTRTAAGDVVQEKRYEMFDLTQLNDDVNEHNDLVIVNYEPDEGAITTAVAQCLLSFFSK